MANNNNNNNSKNYKKKAIGNKVIILLAVNELWAPVCMHTNKSTADMCVWKCVQRHTHGPHVRTWKQQIAIDVHIICISNIVQHTNMFY